jgi:hypothetical protein
VHVLTAELTKLKGSLAWTVVVLLPLVMMGAGVFTTLVGGERLQDGWDTLWMRSVVFYGLLPYPLAVGVLAALVWRPEHRGGNWNALMTLPVPPARIVAAKTAVVALLCAAMQVVMLLVVVATGTALGLDGTLPAQYVLALGVVAVASLPLAALQSGLAMLMRSFAGPVAVALVGAATSIVLLAAGVAPATWVLPHLLAARATQLGTGTFLDGGAVDAASVAPLLGATVLLSALVLTASAQVLRRRDVHV